MSIAVQGDNTFIQDVLEFIDQPLSPTSLNKLKRSCKAQPGYTRSRSPANQTASPASYLAVTEGPGAGSSSLEAMFPVGSEIEAQHLHNTTEFNGLRGFVIGHQDEKVLVEFHCGNGQVFDIPPHNLKIISTPAGPAATTPAAASPGAGLAAPTSPIVTESLNLQAKLRLALSHVEAAKEAMIIATQLHILDPELLYTTISEFQPTLSRANIAKNWAKVVQIYQMHAERVERGAASTQPTHTPLPVSAAPVAPSLTSPAPAGTAQLSPPTMGEDELAQSLEGVIHFIDAPLSPRTLREVRTLRHSMSPKRDRHSQSPALPQTSQPAASPYQASPYY